MSHDRAIRRDSRVNTAGRKIRRALIYSFGFISWGLAIGGVGRLAAFIMQEIRENDRRNTVLVYDVTSGRLHTAILLSKPLEGVSAFTERPPTSAADPL